MYRSYEEEQEYRKGKEDEKHGRSDFGHSSFAYDGPDRAYFDGREDEAREERRREEEREEERQLECEREKEQYEEQQRIHEEENRSYDEQCDWERQQEDLRIIKEAEFAERMVEIERQEKQEMDDYYESFIEVPEERTLEMDVATEEYLESYIEESEDELFNGVMTRITEEDLFNFIQKDERGE